MTREIDHTKACFVIMPFGTKLVGDRRVDFDVVYENIFEPAIRATPLPEGGHLVPVRADANFFAGDIDRLSFEHLEYSRFAIADISALNPNVFFELGVRHRARATGTAVFRLAGAPLPFDISQIKAFEYEYEPEAEAEGSRQFITLVLTESLEENRLDSPVVMALTVQQQRGHTVDTLLQEAEHAIRRQDLAAAEAKYYAAVDADAENINLRMKLGLILKERGKMSEALEQFTAATALNPFYGEAQRERGIVENRIYLAAASPGGLPDGEAWLRQAIELNPNDFDALASLGGVLRRQKPPRYAEGYEMYRRATEVSRGHPYPLLNELKLQARAEGRLIPIDDRRRSLLKRAERTRWAQVSAEPPYDAPWCFFDLAEIRLYDGDGDGFLRYLDKGLAHSASSHHPRAFRDSLQLLVDGGIALPGLKKGIRKLEQAMKKPLK